MRRVDFCTTSGVASVAVFSCPSSSIAAFFRTFDRCFGRLNPVHVERPLAGRRRLAPRKPDNFAFCQRILAPFADHPVRWAFALAVGLADGKIGSVFSPISQRYQKLVFHDKAVRFPSTRFLLLFGFLQKRGYRAKRFALHSGQPPELFAFQLIYCPISHRCFLLGDQ